MATPQLIVSPALTAAGWQVISEPRDVGRGLLVAQLSDGNATTVGLRQEPK